MTEFSIDALREMHDREIRALRDLFLAEIRRLDENAASAEKALTLVATERQNAQDKFEETVRARFVQQNEFRDSLDDLGKVQATRRELEAAVDAMRTERAALLQSLQSGIARNSDEIDTLRSRMDKGPEALHTLQARSDQSVGAGVRSKEFVAYAFSAIAVAVAVVAVLVNAIH